MRLSGSIYVAAVLSGLCSLSYGQITGKVMLKGESPELPEIKAMQTVGQCADLHKDPVYEDSVVVSDKNEIAHVIVFIKPAAGKILTGPQREDTAVLDQKGCMYTPHVLAVQVGQPIRVKNSDPFLHNVHTLAILNRAFNFAEVNVVEKRIDPFTAVETFQIKCDVHPWMKAVVRVFDHPYFAATDEAGKFTINTKGLPDGTYTLQAWQEVYQDSQPQQIEVKGGKVAKPVEFIYEAKKAAKAQAEPVKPVHITGLAQPTG